MGLWDWAPSVQLEHMVSNFVLFRVKAEKLFHWAAYGEEFLHKLVGIFICFTYPLQSYPYTPISTEEPNNNRRTKRVKERKEKKKRRKKKVLDHIESSNYHCWKFV